MGCASSLPAVVEGDLEAVASWRRCVVSRRPRRAVSARCLPVGARSKAAPPPTPIRKSEVQSQDGEREGTRVSRMDSEVSAGRKISDKSSTLTNSPGIGTGISDELPMLFANSPTADEIDLQERSPTKERRLGFGTEVVREQLRRLAVGGPEVEVDRTNFFDMSSSEDMDLEEELVPLIIADNEDLKKPEGVSDAICNALRDNQVFKGIDQWLLQQMVDRMFGVSYSMGTTIVQQGNRQLEDKDCMFYLEKGEVDVVISGDVDRASGNEPQKVEGNMLVIRKGPHWVFGDVALLFDSPRTASIVSATPATTWAMEKKTFLQFVWKHAPRARTLRFVRKFPLLKGLSDNILMNIAPQLSEKTYNDGDAIIRIGEQGNHLFLIRRGKVRVLRPCGKESEKVEVACLGRGHVVGERTMVTGKLRSADCIASGKVRVVVINKKDFGLFDNPLLSWMLDYDAATCALKMIWQLCNRPHLQFEQIIERFDSCKTMDEGDIILREGQLVNKLYVLKTGELTVQKGNEILTQTESDFIREAGGYSFFGDEVVHSIKPSPVTITVESEVAQILTLSRSELDQFLGPAQEYLPVADIASIVSVLEKVPLLNHLAEEKLETIAPNVEVLVYAKGDVVASPSKPLNAMLVVKTGQCLLKVESECVAWHQYGQVEIARELNMGDHYGENALLNDPTSSDDGTVICNQRAEVMFLNKDAIELAIGGSLHDVLKDVSKIDALGLPPSRLPVSGIKFSDLEQHRIVGTGQFGLVRVVRHTPTDEAYALKVIHKAPITEPKQVEHVVNERKVLEEASHPFCVSLVCAFQDASSLYLLQEWVPGGELFHHLDLEGSFDEATAMFYAANVLVALEFLHSRGIVYRDLKPENLLLDLTGYIKVADFGFAKKIGKEPTFTICGTPDYQAPEVIMRRGTSKAADYWSLGVLIFEMLVGDPPFKSVSGDPWDTFRRTLSGRFYVPNFISAEAADIIYKLLQVNPERRLGSGPGGADDIKNHRWFAGLNWTELMEKRLPAPVIPRVHNLLDTSNFDVFDGVDAPPNIPDGRVKSEWGDSWEWVDTF